MKLSEIRWKGMHPAGLMKGLAERLGTEDPHEFLRILRTDTGRVMKMPWMGDKCLREILRVLGEAGYDVENILII